MSGQWDYRNLEGTPNPEAMLIICQREGENGWELCDTLLTIRGAPNGVLKGISLPPPQPVVIMTFKRPKSWLTDNPLTAIERDEEPCGV